MFEPLSSEFLLKKGKCCNNGCKNCPYKNKSMENKLKIAICAIMLNENEYLEEWLNYHRKLGIAHFFIYDNNSDIPIKETLKEGNEDVTIIEWRDIAFKSQSRAYEHCCKIAKDYEYIAFIDADEFIDCDSKDINKTIDELIKFYGRFDGLAMYWRIYGSNNPYYETRKPIEEYTKYSKNDHIKSIVDRRKVMQWLDPHKAILTPKSIYIDENGDKVVSPIGKHTSNIIWIKHCFTRSLAEFQEKMTRGDANLRRNTRTMDDFYHYNDNCTLQD